MWVAGLAALGTDCGEVAPSQPQQGLAEAKGEAVPLTDEAWERREGRILCNWRAGQPPHISSSPPQKAQVLSHDRQIWVCGVYTTSLSGKHWFGLHLLLA